MSRHAIEREYRRSFNERVKYVMARRMSKEDAEDVVQETFYRALRYMNTYNPHLQKLPVWLDVIMNNSIKKYKHANMTGDYSFTEDMEEEVCEFEHERSLTDKENISMVLEELSKLTTQQRNVLYAHHILGHTQRDCTMIFDMSLSMVRQVVHRFKVRLRKVFDEEGSNS